MKIRVFHVKAKSISIPLLLPQEGGNKDHEIA